MLKKHWFKDFLTSIFIQSMTFTAVLWWMVELLHVINTNVNSI